MTENGYPCLYQRGNGKGEKVFNVAIVIMVIAMAIFLFLNTFVYFVVCVTGTSMEKNFHTGECLVVNKYAKYDYGDVIIVARDDKLVIKRVIALGGDSVMLNGGEVFIKKNGQDEYQKLKEDYVYGNYTAPYPNCPSEWILKEDEVFYMGDNRNGNASLDCREYGPVKVQNVKGRVTDWSIKIKGFLGKVNEIFNF